MDVVGGHVDGTRAHDDFSSCRGFFSVPGPVQTVQRAELWGVTLALQSSIAVHVGLTILECCSACWALAGWLLSFSSI